MITINNSVDILGTKYTIELCEFGDKDCDGVTDYTSKVIRIRKDNHNKLDDFDFSSKRTIRHEIIHAFLVESGLAENWEHGERWGHDETFIDWFALQFDKINKAIRDVLHKPDLAHGADKGWTLDDAKVRYGYELAKADVAKNATTNEEATDETD